MAPVEVIIMVDQNPEVRRMLNATTVSRKSVGVTRREKKSKEPESSNAQGCVASTSDDGKILYNEATTVSEGRKRLSDV